MATSENSIVEILDANVNLFLFFSDILGRPVVGADGAPIGKIADLKVKLGELFPRVSSLAVRKRRQKGLWELDWQQVQDLNSNAVSLRAGAEQGFRPLEVKNDEILLRDELLDKQVVDTFGAKIERVNDVHLLIVKQDLRLVHIDYGIRGIIRRLGWLRALDAATNWLFAYQIGEKMISWKFIQPLLSGLVRGSLKLNVTSRKIHEIHPSDLADIIEELDTLNRSSVFRALDLQTAAQTLEEVEDPKLQVALIESAPADRASDILEEMAPDEATDLLADLPEEKAQRLMRTMEKPSREVIEGLLQFKEGTAGSLMTTDFFAVGKDRTIGEAIEEFRKTTYPLESVAYIYVTDKDGRLVGVSTLRHLVICERDIPLRKLMNPHLVSVTPEEDADIVKDLFKKYKFLALPVVDEERRLTGIITLKDIMQERFEE
jgi:CBS domain-containing protein